MADSRDKVEGNLTWIFIGSKPLGSGEGASGEAWLVENKEKHIEAVLKRPSNNEYTASRILKQRIDLEKEKNALRLLVSNLNIDSKRIGFDVYVPRIIDEGKGETPSDPPRFIVMSKAQGRSLRDFIEGYPGIPLKFLRLISLRLLIGALEILRTAHKKGILYRDFIKTDHLFWDQDNRVVTLIDWGNASPFVSSTGWTDDGEYSISQEIDNILLEIPQLLRDESLSQPILEATRYITDPDEILATCSRTALRLLQKYNHIDIKKVEAKTLIEKGINSIKEHDDFCNILNEIIQDEPRPQPLLNKALDAHRRLFVSFVDKKDWDNAYKILHWLISYASNQEKDTLNVCRALIQFIGRAKFDPGTDSINILQSILDEMIWGDVNIKNLDPWFKIIRLNDKSLSSKLNRKLWVEARDALSTLYGIDKNHLYNIITELLPYIDSEKVRVSKLNPEKNGDYIHALVFLEKSVQYWLEVEKSWNGLSYKPVENALNLLKISILENGQSFKDLINIALSKIGALERKIDIITLRWKEKRFDLALADFDSLQLLDPDRRQLESARQVLLKNEIPKWLQTLEKQNDSKHIDKKTAQTQGEKFEVLFGEVDWLTNRLMVIKHINMLIDNQVDIANFDKGQKDWLKENVQILTPALTSIWEDLSKTKTTQRENILSKKPDAENALSKKSNADEIGPEESNRQQGKDEAKDYAVINQKWLQFADALESLEVDKSLAILDGFPQLNNSATHLLYCYKFIINLTLTYEGGNLPELSDLESFQKKIDGIPLNELPDSIHWLKEFLTTVLRWVEDQNTDLSYWKTKKCATWFIQQQDNLKIIKSIYEFNWPNDHHIPISELIRRFKETNETNSSIQVKELLTACEVILEQLEKLYNIWVGLIKSNQWSDKAWEQILELSNRINRGKVHEDVMSDINSSLQKATYTLLMYYPSDSFEQIITEMDTLASHIKNADSLRKKLKINSTVDEVRDYLDKLCIIQSSLLGIVPIRGAPFWKNLFENIVKSNRKSYRKILISEKEAIATHPVKDWIRNYKPRSSLIDKFFELFEKFILAVRRYTVPVLFFGLGCVIVYASIRASYSLLNHQPSQPVANTEIVSPPIISSDNPQTPEQSTGIVSQPQTSLPNVITLTPLSDSQLSCAGLINLLTIQDLDLLQEYVLTQSSANISQLGKECIWNGNNALSAAIYLIVNDKVNLGKYNDALIFINIMPTELISPEIAQLKLNIENRMTISRVCKEIDGKIVSEDGLKAIDTYIKQKSESLGLTHDQIQAVCGNVNLSANVVQTQEYNLKTPYEWGGSFLPAVKDLVGPSYFDKTYQVIYQNVPSNNVLQPTTAFALRLGEIITWNEFDSLEIQTQWFRNLGRLEENTGWGLIINTGDNIPKIIELISNAGSTSLYYVVKNEISLLYLDPGHSLEQPTSIKLQVVGPWLFIYYGYKNTNTYILVPSLEPIFIENNNLAPEIYFAAVNSSDSEENIRFLFEKLIIRIKTR